MMRQVLGVIAGVLIGVTVISIAESIGHMIFPPPEGVDLKDPEALASIMREIPVGAKISVLMAWGLGVFVGGTVAMLVAERKTLPAWIVAGLLFAFAVMTMVMIPHPAWMMIGSVIITIAAALAATKMMARA